MKTQDLLLLGIGVGIGYLAVKSYGKKRMEKQAEDIATQLAAKTKDCEAKWVTTSSTMKFAQGTIDAAKTNFMASCLNPEITAVQLT